MAVLCGWWLRGSTFPGPVVKSNNSDKQDEPGGGGKYPQNSSNPEQRDKTEVGERRALQTEV